MLTGDKLHREPNDAVFDYKFDKRQWRTIETLNVAAGLKDDFRSKFTVLERRTKRVRYIDVKDYYTEVETKNNWIKDQLDLFDDLKIKNLSKPLRVPYQYQLFEDGEPHI